jgi:hypothetical protein
LKKQHCPFFVCNNNNNSNNNNNNNLWWNLYSATEVTVVTVSSMMYLNVTVVNCTFVLNCICVPSTIYYLITYLLFVCLCKTETCDKTERQTLLPSSQNLKQWTLFSSYSHFPKIQLVPNMVFCLPIELTLWT